jgi:hypothetical protein
VYLRAHAFLPIAMDMSLEMMFFVFAHLPPRNPPVIMPSPMQIALPLALAITVDVSI